MLDPYWPNTACGTVIVTTRNPNLAQTHAFVKLPVPEFSKTEAVKFLFKLCPTVSRGDALEIDACLQISERLGYLPLVLDLVGSYIRSVLSSFKTFLRNYPDFERTLVLRDSDVHGFQPQAYSQPTTSTWTIGLTSATEDARLLMDCLALLYPDRIPVDIFGVIDLERK